jgi:hypothetical protein
VEIVSEEHNSRTYWHNPDTGVTTWVRPADILIPTPSTTTSAAAIETNNEAQSDWIEHRDEERGHPYWTNSVTGEATWYEPDEMAT